MSWISIILLVVKYGPAIYEIVTEIFELIGKLNKDGRSSEAVFARSALNNAVEEYKKSKDRRLLRGLRDRLRKDCYGDCDGPGPKAA